MPKPGTIVAIEFCEKCQDYRFFTKRTHSQDPWVCMGHSDYTRYDKGEIDCGQEGYRPRDKNIKAH